MAGVSGVGLGIAAGAVWLVFCAFLYKPGGWREWLRIWLKTGVLLILMYYLSVGIESVARRMATLGASPLELVGYTAFLTGLLGGFFFCWKGLLRRGNTIGESILELAISAAIIKKFHIYSDFQGFTLLFVVAAFIVLMMLMSRFVEYLKKRFLSPLAPARQHRIRLGINVVMMGPVFLIPILYLTLYLWPQAINGSIAIQIGHLFDALFVHAFDFLLDLI